LYLKDGKVLQSVRLLHMQFQKGREEMTERTAEILKDRRRLSRMRMGQDAPEYRALISDPEIRVALVPMTEAEHEQGMKMAAQINLPDNEAALAYRDRWMQVCDLVHIIREPRDLKKKMFESPEELIEALEVGDVNYLSEEYIMLVDQSSPHLDGLNDEQLEELKKAFSALDLSALSGRAWWLLKNFFLTISLMQLPVKLPGSFSTLNLTEPSESNESTPGVTPN
jgi:hypothetical protein